MSIGALFNIGATLLPATFKGGYVSAANAGSGGNVSATLAATPVATDTVVVIGFGSQGGGDIKSGASVTVGGSAMTRIMGIGASLEYDLGAWVITGVTSTSVVMTIPTDTNTDGLIAFILTGIAASSPLDGAVQSTLATTGANPATPTYTPGFANDVLIAAIADSNTITAIPTQGTWASAGGATINVSMAGGVINANVSYQIQTTLTARAPAWTATSGTNSRAVFGLLNG